MADETRDERADQAAATSDRWLLPVAFLLVCGVFLGLTEFLNHAINRVADFQGGVRCDDSSDFFYTPPCPQQFAWVWTSSAYAVLELSLAVPAYRWRRTLVEEFRNNPPGRGWWLAHVKHPANLLVPLAFYLTLLFQGRFGPTLNFNRLEQTVVSAPVTLLVLPIGLAILSIFDISSIANGPDGNFIPSGPAQIQRLRNLRKMLDRFLLILGIQTGAWVVTHAANAEFAIAIKNASSPTAPSELTAGKIVVVVGTVATGVIALLYIPTAIAIDRLALRMVEDKSRQLDWENDPDTAKSTLDQLTNELVVKQSLQDRLYTGLSIAAPLTGAIFTTFVL
jgi:hypothetical protein